MTIAQAFNEITVAQGGTASTSGTIAGAIDALNDALAGSDQQAAQSIESAVRLLGAHIGGGGSSVTVEPLSVTENDTYTAPEGKAYSPVTVNVPSSGLAFPEVTAEIRCASEVAAELAYVSLVNVCNEDNQEYEIEPPFDFPYTLNGNCFPSMDSVDGDTYTLMYGIRVYPQGDNTYTVNYTNLVNCTQPNGSNTNDLFITDASESASFTATIIKS